MSSLEMLARVNPNGVSFDHVPGGAGAITREDIVGALQGVPAVKVRLALLLVAGQGDERHRLEQEVSRMWEYDLNVLAADDARVREWIRAHPGVMQKLCSLAIGEVVETRACRVCEGTGVRKLSPVKRETCSFCGGTGNKGFTARDRAKRAGIPRLQWAAECAAIYDRILDLLFTWLQSVKRRLDQLRRDSRVCA